MAVLGLCCCAGFSLTAVLGGFSSSRSQASDCGGSSWCCAPGAWVSVAAAPGSRAQSCGSPA